MLGLPEFDGDPQGRYREYAASLHSGSRRGGRRLSPGATVPTARGRPRILALDTAGAACSVAVAAGEVLIACRCRAMERGQAEALLPMVDAAMRASGLGVTALDLVAATVGPGSFTGIRVGLAAARGMALAAGLPLIGVTGFEAIAALLGASVDNPLLLVALESRRADLCVQLFERDRPLVSPAMVPPESLAAWIEAGSGRRPLAIAGDATARAAAALDGWRCVPLASPHPVAVGVAGAARRRWCRGERGRRVEPLYLRPPDVTRPHGAAGGGGA